MKPEEAELLVRKTFKRTFDRNQFLIFIQNLSADWFIRDENHISGNNIQKDFQDYIASYQRLAKMESGQFLLDVLAIKLRKSKHLENARTMQRAFVARYLNGDRGGKMRDAALVAFYSTENEPWRFSLVYKDHVWDESAGPSTTLSAARRYSFLVGPNEPTHTAEKQLADLLLDGLPPASLATLERLKEAFTVELVTKEFFNEYKRLFELTTAAVEQAETYNLAALANCGIKPDMFAKRLLGQLVFLYFLQKKGWLGVSERQKWGEGPHDYLRRLFQRSKSENTTFFKSFLEPLFYEGLAEDRSDVRHHYSPFEARIPFLNGGLFEPLTGYDWKDKGLNLPNNIFEEILTVFDRYNFTVREDEPLEKEVAVDPEMLGKVFENLLESATRKETGTFYTPRDIVHYMVRESLSRFLDNAINYQVGFDRMDGQKSLFLEANRPDLFYEETRRQVEKIPFNDLWAWVHAVDSVRNEAQTKSAIKEKARRDHLPDHDFHMPEAVERYAKELDTALANLRICDPAIGSGAFPVGLLLEIVRLRRALQSKFADKPQSSYELKRETILHSIYGVDIDPSAVDVAKLRLWLSLVVDEESFDDIKPLPNLDYKIMVGNSLAISTGDDLFATGARKRIKPLKDRYFSLTDKAEKERLRSEIADLMADIKSDSAFDWHSDFCEVFDEPHKGFDLVVANPPYVRQEAIKDLKKDLAKNFPNFYASTADLYTYFYSLSLAHLLKPFGHSCFIAPNKFFRAAYGKNLRRFLTGAINENKDTQDSFSDYKKARLKQIIDFEDLPVFAATTYPSIVLAEAATTAQDHSFKAVTIKDMKALPKLNQAVAEKSFTVMVQDLSPEGWTLEKQDIQNLLRKIKACGRPLKEVVNKQIYYGIKTGFNDAFVIDEATKDRLVTEDPASAELIKPWLRGRDIKKWKAEPAGLYIINIQNGGNHPWPWTGKTAEEAERIFENTYPAIYKHLHSTPGWRERLIKRSDQGEYFWEMRACAYTGQFEKPKIVYPDISQVMRASFDTEGAFLANTAYILISDIPQKILSILHSSVFLFYAQNCFSAIQGNSYRFIAQYMEPFPIPDTTIEQEIAIRKIVGEILHRKAIDPAANVVRQEDELDKIVYGLYGLTDEEITLIETTISLDREDTILIPAPTAVEPLPLQSTQLKPITKQTRPKSFPGTGRTAVIYNCLPILMFQYPDMRYTQLFKALLLAVYPDVCRNFFPPEKATGFDQALACTQLPLDRFTDTPDFSMITDQLQRKGITFYPTTDTFDLPTNFKFRNNFGFSPLIPFLLEALEIWAGDSVQTPRVHISQDFSAVAMTIH